jgi:hypothetical protein
LASSLTLESSHKVGSDIPSWNKRLARSVYAPVAAIFHKVRRAGKRIGEAQARALMLAFYYVVLGPFFFLGAKRLDPLGIDPAAEPVWRVASDRPAVDHKHQQY